MRPIDDLASTHVPKILVVCDRRETMPLWGYVLRQQGMIAILETSVAKAIDRWSTEMPELFVIDVDTAKQDPLEMCKQFRAVSLAPMLLLLPSYHETQILEAYEAGADDVIIKQNQVAAGRSPGSEKLFSISAALLQTRKRNLS